MIFAFLLVFLMWGTCVAAIQALRMMRGQMEKPEYDLQIRLGLVPASLTFSYVLCLVALNDFYLKFFS
jgi:hypothetical protein